MFIRLRIRKSTMKDVAYLMKQHFELQEVIERALELHYMCACAVINEGRFRPIQVYSVQYRARYQARFKIQTLFNFPLHLSRNIRQRRTLQFHVFIVNYIYHLL